jgi:hypothetical protein
MLVNVEAVGKYVSGKARTIQWRMAPVEATKEMTRNLPRKRFVFYDLNTRRWVSNLGNLDGSQVL